MNVYEKLTIEIIKFDMDNVNTDTITISKKANDDEYLEPGSEFEEQQQ